MHSQEHTERTWNGEATAESAGDRESCPGCPGVLVVVHSPDADAVGRIHQLSDELTLIGREIDAHGLCVDDRIMSRVHARFVHDTRAGMFRVGDGGSRNGTFVNGQAVDSVLLSDGAVIRAGDTLLVYREGDAMERTRQRAEALAPTDLCLLLCGETGTGKEVLARHIHRVSGRTGDLVGVNCAGLPADLVAAELFGHTKQAFSGASQARSGLFMAAQHGTLLLDEIGDCPLDVQAALLRAIQEKRIRAIGADREVAVDVRIIAATNVALDVAIASGRFRADLFARLSQSQVVVPPLRARRADLLQLLLEQVPDGTRRLEITADAAEALLLWQWPMNVRELQALVRSHVAVNGTARLDLPALAKHAPAIAAPLYDRRRATGTATTTSSGPPPHGDRGRLRDLLEANGGNVSAVADALGKPRAQVYRWMKSMGLSAVKFRG